MRTMILTPAYGRDYTNRDQVEMDFRNGRDFVLNRQDGSSTYCNIDDLNVDQVVNIRYRSKTKVHVITVTAAMKEARRKGEG